MSSILEESRRSSEEFIAIRRDIHRHPELAFDEHRTSALVADRLEAWGYTVQRGLGGTGVVGQLARGKGTRRLGIRADMDALPIQEETGLPYASHRDGVMHACGHDGHTAMLLSAARHLATRGRFSGTLNLIFQPAEEGGGGALRMIEDGLFEKHPCDAIFAMHTKPGLAQGVFSFRSGEALASSDYATVTIKGTGGHGAAPHRTADPVVAAASAVMALQTVVSRNIDPLQMAVVTVGAIHAGCANNVIPAAATLEISLRSLNREVRTRMEQRIKAIVIAQAASFGCVAEVDWRRGYAVLVNSSDETEFARQVAKELVGTEQVIPQGPPLAGSEDFAFMLEKVPGSYLLIGNDRECDEGACMVHTSGYDFNDDNVALGSAYWVLLCERFLA